MRYSQLSFVIAAAAVVGCSDSSSPTQIERAPTATPSRTATLFGTVIPNTTDRSGALLALRVEDGTEIALTGDQAGTMSTLIGDGVEVSGVLDDVGQLTVQRFVLLTVGGESVMDGVLDLTEDGFTLHLTAGGHRIVIDPPEELQQLVGNRVWIAGPDGATPTAFGVIAFLTPPPAIASRREPRASWARGAGMRP